MKKLLIIFVLLLFYRNSNFAQTSRIEFVKNAINKAKNEEEKLNSLLLFAEEYQSINRDSFNLYVVEIKKLASKSKSKYQQVFAKYIEATNYYRWGWTDSAKYIIEPVLKANYKKDKNLRDLYLKSLRLKAMCYGVKSLFKESMALHLQLAKEAEIDKDTLMMGLSYNSLGSVNMALSENETAQNWIKKAINICKHPKRHEQILAPSYLNLANYFTVQNLPDSAIFFLNKAMTISRKIENLNYISTGLRIESSILMSQKKWNSAEKVLIEMFEIRKKMNGSSSIVEDNLQMADFYAKTGQYQKAINICKENLKKGDLYKVTAEAGQNFNNATNNRLDYLEALAKYYKLAHQYPGYQATLEEFIAVKDSFNTANSLAEIAELQTKYEVEKKEKTIAEQTLKITQKNYWLYGSAIFTALLSIIGWLIFKNYRRKQAYKLKKALEEEKQLAAQQIIDAEEQERKRIAADLHDNIGAYATAIRADVEKITDKGIENSDGLLQNLQLHSDEIIGSLRDTIWVLNKENITVTSLSDRLKSYVNKLQLSYENIAIQINENIENDQKISSQKALNIFRILQEAIHNTLKHSKAKSLSINILSHEKMAFEVIDDGVGFDEKTVNLGEGLHNMKARAVEIGMGLKVISDAKGTELKLE
jgi:signal transduction histidine kinase